MLTVVVGHFSCLMLTVCFMLFVLDTLLCVFIAVVVSLSCFFYKGTGTKVSGKSPKKPVGMQSSAGKGVCKLPSHSGKYCVTNCCCTVFTCLDLQY